MSSGEPATEDGGMTGHRVEREDAPTQKTTGAAGRGTDEQDFARQPQADVLFSVLESL
ncbi:MAG: hypothetical protein ACLPYY_02530 [Acidimicrobiales bacterium]